MCKIKYLALVLVCALYLISGVVLASEPLKLTIAATDEDIGPLPSIVAMPLASAKGVVSSYKASHKKSHSKKAAHFHRPAYIAREIWDQMSPYFLPREHEVRAKLDKMFSKKRLTANSETLTAAGFYGRKDNKAGLFSHVTVACHEKLEGYVLKFFTDDSVFVDWIQLKKRIDGARSLQASIQRHEFGKWFKVPQKWIYPLPETPAPLLVEGVPAKGFILVAENMLLLNKHQNRVRWLQNMTTAKLDALYTLLQEQGLLDSVYPFNIPFCCDGRIAFIDLEHNHLWPVPFFKLQPYLNSSLQAYWENIATKPVNCEVQPEIVH